MDCTDFTWNRYSSSYRVILHGVPQGSILGSLLFLLYINELPLIFEGVNFVLYADDTNIRGLLEKYPTFFFMRTPDGL